MFWNTEFLNSTPSNIDNLLQKEDVKLGEILFEDDLLQELKTSNYSLISFLNKQEIINELVENITQLTEKDCCDKLVYSRVHVAYISCEILTGGSSEIISTLMADSESLNKILICLTKQPKVVPQKATLISKLISTIHSMAAANLSCHITQDIDSFSKLINLLVSNIEISGSFEILSTFIKRTDQSELRFAFCEILSKLNFVNSLIDVMTLSEVEDKQRNACQLLCDIIVIGRQEASEQTNSEPIAQDMLAEYLESTPAVRLILDQMFDDDRKNSTAIICGMKLLQTLFENKQITNTGLQMMRKKIEQTQEEIEKHLYKFHELLLNPPKQEPIRTTFGIIQKPLGYMRLEVVTLFRALIGTNLPNIIRKMVELNTMKVIVDLFIEYCWNNLLHTQVEQALCLIINNYRYDEELNYAIDMNNQQVEQPAIEIPSRALLSQLLNECDVIGRLLLPNSSNNSVNNNNNINTINNNSNNNGKNTNNNNDINTDDSKKDDDDGQEEEEGEGEDKDVVGEGDDEGQIKEEHDDDGEEGEGAKENKDDNSDDTTNNKINNSHNNGTTTTTSNNSNHTTTLNNNNNMTTTNNAQANFGHIIKMINSIAINSDLDTIKEHLNEMKDKRPELYDRWSTFVNVDVASFKEISLYFDAQSANNNVTHSYGGHNNLNNNNTNHNNNQQSVTMNNSQNSTHSDDDNNEISEDKEDAHQFFAYFSFTRENVLPTINVDVLPKMRRV